MMPSGFADARPWRTTPISSSGTTGPLNVAAIELTGLGSGFDLFQSGVMVASAFEAVEFECVLDRQLPIVRSDVHVSMYHRLAVAQ